MEPRKDELKKSPEPRKEERKRRFQIVKLEERIAPRQGFQYHYQGHCGHGGCK
jgi:hypothetical protein